MAVGSWCLIQTPALGNEEVKKQRPSMDSYTVSNIFYEYMIQTIEPNSAIDHGPTLDVFIPAL